MAGEWLRSMRVTLNYLKGDTVMVAAFGAFGALYLAGMIAMTVRGLKD